MLNFENLDRMIAEKYISVQKHPEFDLYIYNYSHRAQFDRVWNNETLQCRGLIMDGNRNIVSRPFKKFFNWGEATVSQTRNLRKKMASGDINFIVTEKMDGSLGISYFGPDGKMYIATRGSFVSDQAKKANEIWAAKYCDLELPQSLTFLFEIVYPQNRIVVNYGDTEDLILLAAIDTKYEGEFSYHDLEFFARSFKIPVVKAYDGITDFEKIEERPNSEGYVIHFPDDDLRLKVKFSEYTRLHKILTGVNAKRIWEILKAGESLDEILERVPDEFYGWVEGIKKKLQADYHEVEDTCKFMYATVKYLPTRKDQALFIQDTNLSTGYKGVVFRMLDGKDYREAIWNTLEPKFEKPFKIDVDA